MKLASLLLFLLINIFPTKSQEVENRSLLSQGAKITGWYLGSSSSFTRLNGIYTNMPGVEAGLVMKKDFRIGFAGKSFSCYETQLLYRDVLDEKCYLNGGYGGLVVEAAHNAGNLLHVTVPFLVGVGGVTYLSAQKYPEPDDDGEIDFSRRSLSASPFFVLEPGINLELNLTGFLKVYGGFSYRWLNGLSLENTSYNALNGCNFNAGIKIGKL